MENKDQKHSLITEASSSIGYELAKLFAEYSYNLVLIGRNDDTLKQAGNEMLQLSESIHPHVKAENTVTYKEGDLYSPEEVARAGYTGLKEWKYYCLARSFQYNASSHEYD